MSFEDFYRDFYHRDLLKLQDTQTSTFYQIRLNRSVGNMEVYTLFDGVELIFGSFMGPSLYEKSFKKNSNILHITFCQEGSYEAILEGDIHKTLQKNSLCALNLDTKLLGSCMPQGFNESISFLIHLDIAHKELLKVLKHINLLSFNEKIYKNILFWARDRTAMSICHQMGVHKALGADYLRVKFLELMIHLTSHAHTPPKAPNNLAARVDAYIQAHCEENYPLSHLAQVFNVSITKLQKDFYQAYDSSLYQYIKYQKIQKAIYLLTQNNYKITQAASEVGYTNTSKFCENFKKITGRTPLEYKKISQKLTNTD
ncbi:hypothetical protein BKH46_05055 [Helicobacter sp. 12S02634-8]|uniref:helix-turn-helix domain-containing protein n=1 Tax=Helicobacter sp. 12S02634-8 TaxID=1476199 RepID=UPI000BA7056F|nr:AraC family transcriptional regulator [Helicobacter sp. 12S02634-8]PAF47088.1 hypothetical protein BKH46_05055 [Helicobacter sp. 12S02634-8]